MHNTLNTLASDLASPMPAPPWTVGLPLHSVRVERGPQFLLFYYV